ncbi:hypothetical protein H6G97_36495 [Nostoc flagelliforme FACHB-838]|uniref:Transposase n=1 Tax=Nostoc flagelliforme FACHB-838 TaxID=2692904 RepID=A0ABR8DYX3_9NOSO|nr:hypothetical protein [Nostoc flagelliforme FACHB-838]
MRLTGCHLASNSFKTRVWSASSGVIKKAGTQRPRQYKLNRVALGAEQVIASLGVRAVVAS